MVGYFIEDACTESIQKIEKYLEVYSPDYSSTDNCINQKCVMLSQNAETARQRIYQNIIVDQVICSEQISISDSKAEYLIKQLFKAFYTHPKQLPDYVLVKYCKGCNIDFNRATLNIEQLQSDSKFIRTICDHIAGMTDQFAAREYNRLYIPEYQ